MISSRRTVVNGARRARNARLAGAIAVAIFAAVLTVGCVLNWDSLREPDGGAPEASQDALAPDEAADRTRDGDANIETDAADASDAAQPIGDEAGVCALRLLINEVEVEGAQGPADEFVEIRNGASCGGSLFNWTVRYSSAAGSSPSILWTGQAGDVIGATGSGGYVVLGGFAFQGAVIGRISSTITGSLGKAGGGVGLFRPDGTLVDGVAYAVITTPTHPFVRPATAADGGPSTPAPNPPSAKSIARSPDGQNTNTNATDFQLESPPTPGAPNL